MTDAFTLLEGLCKVAIDTRDTVLDAMRQRDDALAAGHGYTEVPHEISAACNRAALNFQMGVKPPTLLACIEALRAADEMRGAHPLSVLPDKRVTALAYDRARARLESLLSKGSL